jgi:uroporphyrinogen III methyltransferase / synthase
MKRVVVGVGIGDPELLTARARTCIGRADLAVVGPDVPEPVLALLPPGCPRLVLDEAVVGGALSVDVKYTYVVVLVTGEPARVAHGLGPVDEIVPALQAQHLLETFAGLAGAGSLAVVDAEPGVGDRISALSAAVDLLVLRARGPLSADVAAAIGRVRRPLHLVSGVATTDQRVLPTTAETLLRDMEVGPFPLLLVSGASAGPRWFAERPLFGRRIVLTRPEGQADASLALFREAGADAISLPAIAIAAPADPAPLRAAAASLGSYDWVVFTSANGVRALLSALVAAGKDARAFGNARVACIGPETARALASAMLRADLVPREHVGEGLAQELLAAIGPGPARVLIPRAKVARDVVPAALTAAGHAVDVITAYETHPAEQSAARARELLAVGAADAVLFSSSSTATSFVSFVGKDALAKVTVASIGPVTSKTLEDQGVRVDVTAKAFTMQGLQEALVAYYAKP